MKVINPIPIQLDVDEFLRAPLLGRLNQIKMDPLIEKCRKLIEPKAVYTFTSVMNIENDQIHLKNGQTLKSIILSDILESDQTMVPYVVTIGPKLEKQVSEESKGSILQAWILEKMGDYSLEKALAYLRSSVEEILGSCVSSFGPGTGTGKLFGIEQQKTLFQMLNSYDNIGVYLTPSYLMVPRKSLSGVFAATRQEYVACEYCPRERCENRRKPYTGEYAVHCKYKNSL